jgi:hypothetical protein
MCSRGRAKWLRMRLLRCRSPERPGYQAGRVSPEELFLTIHTGSLGVCAIEDWLSGGFFIVRGVVVFENGRLRLVAVGLSAVRARSGVGTWSEQRCEHGFHHGRSQEGSRRETRRAPYYWFEEIGNG